MIRFLFRLMATFSLAVAVIMAVLDATRTIAVSRLVLTPLGESWASVSPSTLEETQSFIVEKMHPLVWNPVMVFILGQPGFLVFGLLAFLLYAIGHKPERRIGRFVAER
ncbi:hypothetical protein ABMA32_03515 [Mesorhizobium sp. VNQ89]|uniref:hypothetical protein n=1 Tax=Mesorhizobium quangtriensis TaxID=3157709 RepID=UPI0032B7E6C8